MPSTASMAADPGRPITTRRSFLAAAPLLGLAAGLPAAGATPPVDTPVARMFRQWLTARIEFAHTPAWLSDEESEPFYLRVSEPSDRIVDLPSTSAADLVMKLAAHTAFFEHSLCDCPGEAALLSEMHQMIGGLSPALAALLAEHRALDGQL